MHILYQVDPIDSRISYHLCHLCNKKNTSPTYGLQKLVHLSELAVEHVQVLSWGFADLDIRRIYPGPFMGNHFKLMQHFMYFWCAWKCTFRFPYGVVCFMPFSEMRNLEHLGNLLVYPEAVLRSRPLSKYMAAVLWLLMLLSLNVAFTSRLNRARASGNWNVDFV